VGVGLPLGAAPLAEQVERVDGQAAVSRFHAFYLALMTFPRPSVPGSLSVFY
jgi:hypothetical protein